MPTPNARPFRMPGMRTGTESGLQLVRVSKLHPDTKLLKAIDVCSNLLMTPTPTPNPPPPPHQDHQNNQHHRQSLAQEAVHETHKVPSLHLSVLTEMSWTKPIRFRSLTELGAITLAHLQKAS